MYFNLNPIQFPEATHKYSGREANDREKSMGQKEKSSELPVYVDNIQTISCWKLKGFLPRLWFLISGKIWVKVSGAQPPVMGLGVGTMFRIKMVSDGGEE